MGSESYTDTGTSVTARCDRCVSRRLQSRKPARVPTGVADADAAIARLRLTLIEVVIGLAGGVRDEPGAGVAVVRHAAVGSGHDRVGGGADWDRSAGRVRPPAVPGDPCGSMIVLRDQ